MVLPHDDHVVVLGTNTPRADLDIDMRQLRVGGRIGTGQSQARLHYERMMKTTTI